MNADDATLAQLFERWHEAKPDERPFSLAEIKGRVAVGESPAQLMAEFPEPDELAQAERHAFFSRLKRDGFRATIARQAAVVDGMFATLRALRTLIPLSRRGIKAAGWSEAGTDKVRIAKTTELNARLAKLREEDPSITRTAAYKRVAADLGYSSYTAIRDRKGILRW